MSPCGGARMEGAEPKKRTLSGGVFRPVFSLGAAHHGGEFFSKAPAELRDETMACTLLFLNAAAIMGIFVPGGSKPVIVQAEGLYLRP